MNKLSHILINEQKLVRILKQGIKNQYLLASGDWVTKDQIDIIETVCPVCSEPRELAKLHKYNRDKASLCAVCKSVGERNPFYGKKHSKQTIQLILNNRRSYKGSENPFHGKTHSDKTKTQLSQQLKGKMIGQSNPFYGKKHSAETVSRIQQGRKKWLAQLTPEDKKKLSKKLSDAQKKIQQHDPIRYKQMKAKGGKAAALAPAKYKINNIEQQVKKVLSEIDSEFEYSVILGGHQYDFGHKNKRILVEVQGDYWHGNPRIYSEEQLNYIQKANAKRDIKKKSFAEQHRFHIFYIWEQDILNNNFKSLEPIKEHFDEI